MPALLSQRQIGALESWLQCDRLTQSYQFCVFPCFSPLEILILSLSRVMFLFHFCSILYLAVHRPGTVNICLGIEATLLWPWMTSRNKRAEATLLWLFLTPIHAIVFSGTHTEAGKAGSGGRSSSFLLTRDHIRSWLSLINIPPGFPRTGQGLFPLASKVPSWETGCASHLLSGQLLKLNEYLAPGFSNNLRPLWGWCPWSTDEECTETGRDRRYGEKICLGLLRMRNVGIYFREHRSRGWFTPWYRHMT